MNHRRPWGNLSRFPELDNTAEADSFTDQLLDYPHYTRPADFRGMQVPEVLLSGNHAEIAKWRAQQAERRTAERRPDLLSSSRRVEAREVRGQNQTEPHDLGSKESDRL